MKPIGHEVPAVCALDPFHHTSCRPQSGGRSRPGAPVSGGYVRYAGSPATGWRSDRRYPGPKNLCGRFVPRLRPAPGVRPRMSHNAAVLTAQPAYKPDVEICKQPSNETINGVEVIRLALFPEKGSGFVKILNGFILYFKMSFI